MEVALLRSQTYLYEYRPPAAAAGRRLDLFARGGGATKGATRGKARRARALIIIMHGRLALGLCWIARASAAPAAAAPGSTTVPTIPVHAFSAVEHRAHTPGMRLLSAHDTAAEAQAQASAAQVAADEAAERASAQAIAAQAAAKAATEAAHTARAAAQAARDADAVAARVEQAPPGLGEPSQGLPPPPPSGADTARSVLTGSEMHPVQGAREPQRPLPGLDAVSQPGGEARQPSTVDGAAAAAPVLADATAAAAALRSESTQNVRDPDGAATFGGVSGRNVTGRRWHEGDTKRGRRRKRSPLRDSENMKFRNEP